MGDCEAGEIGAAEREIFCGPATKDDTLVPAFRVWGNGRYCLGNEAHHCIGIVVELQECVNTDS